MPQTIRIETGPTWLQYVTAIATGGAALAAAWAALNSYSSTKASQRLVQVEVERDERNRSEAFKRQAQRVTVDLSGQPFDVSGVAALDMHARVSNSSADPISKVRIKLIAGGQRWGPMLVGTLSPWQKITVTARVFADPSADDQNAYVRFLDVDGQAWIANARTAVVPDPGPVDQWIADGREFVLRRLTMEEAGMIDGLEDFAPDLDAWRSEMSERTDSA